MNSVQVFVDFKVLHMLLYKSVPEDYKADKEMMLREFVDSTALKNQPGHRSGRKLKASSAVDSAQEVLKLK